MGNQSTCDGTLSADQFFVSADVFCDQWRSANTTLSNWTWIPCKRGFLQSSFDEGYLSMENIYYIKSPQDIVTSQNLFVEDEEAADAATMVQVSSCAIHIYDFHIAYSFSYRIPVLFFNGHQSDGQPLNLDEAQNDLPENSQNLLGESKWTFITVEEHPYLHRPWFMLHPCGTAAWMKLLLRSSTGAANYLLAWLSVVGQAVGLRIPLELLSGCASND